MKTANKTILVLNGTGKTGRRIVQRLQDAGHPVRIGSRKANPAFDWNKPTTWQAALSGISTVYVAYYPDVAIPGAVETVRSFVDLAVACGIGRLVLLSGRGEEEALRAEQVIRESGVEWTILRCSWFAQNFDENFLIDAVRAGEVALPVGDVKEPFVDADDIADVAFAALTEKGHAGELYELTGPRLLSFAEAIGEIAEAIGRPVRYLQLTTAQYRQALGDQDIPDDFTWLLEYLFTTVLDGRNASLADGVRRALGRGPRDFRDYVRETAHSGVWDAC